MELLKREEKLAKKEVINGERLTSHCSTTYPCCRQTLGDWVGASRVRLAKNTKIILFYRSAKKSFEKYFVERKI